MSDCKTTESHIDSMRVNGECPWCGEYDPSRIDPDLPWCEKHSQPDCGLCGVSD